MDHLLNIKHLIGKVWKEPLHSELTSKKVDVSIYYELSQTIPDKFIVIEEVFSENELEEIDDNYAPYLREYQIFPFLGTLGDAVICIGYSDFNKGKLFYFDFDFGCIQLDNDKLDSFICKLVCS